MYFRLWKVVNVIMAWFPIENSTEGAVNRSLDLLVETELTIIAQVFLKVEHSLFSFFPLSEIDEVHSKDQALAQCGDWLRRNLPNARLVPVTSTAEAVKSLNQEKKTRPLLANLPGGFTRSLLSKMRFRIVKITLLAFWL